MISKLQWQILAFKPSLIFLSANPFLKDMSCILKYHTMTTFDTTEKRPFENIDGKGEKYLLFSYFHNDFHPIKD